MARIIFNYKMIDTCNKVTENNKFKLVEISKLCPRTTQDISGEELEDPNRLT